MSTCRTCLGPPPLCTTVYPTLDPCRCDGPGVIQETGETGTTGPKGETPNFVIGSVASGGAAITITDISYAGRSFAFVLPAIPQGVPYTWTKKQTFLRQAIFNQGPDITGGDVSFGGTSFHVIENATFAANLSIAGAGNFTNITTLNLAVSGSLSVQGGTTLADVDFEGAVDLTEATVTLSDNSEFPSSILTLDDCGSPKGLVKRGSDLYTKGEATGLTDITPVNAGAICDTVVINVPASTCGPQVAPVVDIKFRIGYRFGTSPVGTFAVNFWQNGIGTDILDIYTQGGVAQNAIGGCIIVRARTQLALGNNNFDIEVENNDVTESWSPTDVTYWVEN